MRNGGVPFRDVFSSQGPLFLPLVWIADTLGLHTLDGPRLLGLASGLALVIVIYLAGRELGGTDRRPHRRRPGRGDRQQHRRDRLHRRRRAGHGPGLDGRAHRPALPARPLDRSGRRHGRRPRRGHHGQGPGPARRRAGGPDPALGPPAQGLARGRRGRGRGGRRAVVPLGLRRRLGPVGDLPPGRPRRGHPRRQRQEADQHDDDPGRGPGGHGPAGARRRPPPPERKGDRRGRNGPSGSGSRPGGASPALGVVRRHVPHARLREPHVAAPHLRDGAALLPPAGLVPTAPEGHRRGRRGWPPSS